jgi:hypothetical protein
MQKSLFYSDYEQQHLCLCTTIILLLQLLSMREENIGDIVLTKLLSTGRALAMSIAQILIDALLAEEMETPGDGDAFEAVLADRAAQHAQCHLQHIGIFRAQGASTGRIGTARRSAPLFLGCFVLGLTLSFQSIQ